MCEKSICDAVAPPTYTRAPVRRSIGASTRSRSRATRLDVAALCGELDGYATTAAASRFGFSSGRATEAIPGVAVERAGHFCSAPLSVVLRERDGYLERPVEARDRSPWRAGRTPCAWSGARDRCLHRWRRGAGRARAPRARASAPSRRSRSLPGAAAPGAPTAARIRGFVFCTGRARASPSALADPSSGDAEQRRQQRQ